MWLLTPKISWITTMPPRGLPAGSARYAESVWPSAAFSSIILPMGRSSVGTDRIRAMKKDAQALFQLAVSALERAGANPRMAQATARHLVAAEEQGLPTHGISRVPFYCGMLRRGRADGAAQPAMVTERGAGCLLDNRDGLPYVTVQWAIDDL